MRFHVMFCAIACLAIHCTAPSKDTPEDVRAAFNGYKTALLEGNGEDAASFLDSRSLDYYEAILEQVKTADSLEVDKAGLTDKLMILTIRHRLSHDEIVKMNGRTLLKRSIELGLIGREGVENSSIGEVTITGKDAEGEFVVNGKPVPISMSFHKEKGEWKVDITSLFEMSEEAFQSLISTSGLTENEFLTQVLFMTSAKIPEPSVWQPVKH